MISDKSMPSSKYSKLFPVLMAATPTPKVMKMKYLPSRVTLSRRGHFAQNPRLSPFAWAFDFAVVGLSDDDDGTAGAAGFALSSGGFGSLSVGTFYSGTGTRAITSRTAASDSSREGA